MVFKIDLSSIFLNKSQAFLTLFEGGLLVACKSSAQGATILDWENFDSLSSNLSTDSSQQFLSSLAEGIPSTLSLVDSWSDGLYCIFLQTACNIVLLAGPDLLAYIITPIPIQTEGRPKFKILEGHICIEMTESPSSAACWGLGCIFL